MNRLESWLLHISTIILSITGIVYAWMRYVMKPEDPFSVLNHPWEPYMLKAHILVAPLLLLGFGIILHSHILFKIDGGTRTARRSGLLLIPMFVVMVISGYLLQVISSDFRKILVVIHLGSGALWAMVYIGHQVASFAQRRARANGKSRSQSPVLMVLVSLFLAFAVKSEAMPLERQISSMGTMLRIVTLEQNREKALQDTEALIRVVEDTENQLSTWKKNSELSRLNDAPTGNAIPLSPSLFAILRQIKNWTMWTGGAFDPGIGRLLEAWKIHGTFRVPSAQELSGALRVSGLKHIQLNEQNSTVTKFEAILIDPGAFGKGEALDRAIQLAVSRNMAPVLLDFGGQIAVHGIPQNDSGWQAFFAQPEDRSKTETGALVLRSGSLSTSGYSERSGKVDDRTIHHILNPPTGLPVSPFGSVTVWHPSALTADIVSTALCVMGPDSGYTWAVQNNIAAAFITKDNLRKTPEFVKEFNAEAQSRKEKN